MKKSLLALAVLGAFAAGSAQAQTNVSIGGVIRTNIKNYKVSDTTRAAKNELRVDDDWNSRFWLTGTEDLGGGLSAIFYVENRFNTDVQGPAQATGNGLANGDTFVGLKGSWGQVTAGKHTWMATQGITTEVLNGTNGVSAIPTSALATFNVFDQTGTGYLDITRRSNSITYRTPNISGFTGTVGFAASGSNGVEGNLACTGAGVTAINTVATPVAGASTATCPSVPVAGSNYSSGHELFLQGGYANGPLYLNLAFWDTEGEGNVGLDVRQYRFSGSYKIAGFKVGLGVDRASTSPAAGGAKTSRTAWSIPVSYGFGNNTILASFTKAGDRSGVNNSGAKMWTLGYDYALSKRTTVGAYYSRLDNDAAAFYQPFLAGTSFTGSALGLGETASTFGVGIHHTF